MSPSTYEISRVLIKCIDRKQNGDWQGLRGEGNGESVFNEESFSSVR